MHRDVNEAEEEEWLLDDVFIRPFLSVSELFLIEEVLHVPKQCNAKDHIEQTHHGPVQDSENEDHYSCQDLDPDEGKLLHLLCKIVDEDLFL